MPRHHVFFGFFVVSVVVTMLGGMPGCTVLDGTLFEELQDLLGDCDGNEPEGEQEEDQEESYVPEGVTQQWKSKETIGNLRGNLGIYLNINLDARGVFDGQIGNYIEQCFPGWGCEYATYSDLKKGVCGKLNISEGTGIVWPEGEEKTPVTVRLIEDNRKLVVTFTEWPHLEGSDPPGATMWKM